MAEREVVLSYSDEINSLYVRFASTRSKSVVSFASKFIYLIFHVKPSNK